MAPGKWGLARESYPFIAIALLATVLGYIFFWPLGLLCSAFALFCVYFFRDPFRVPPGDPQLLVSPADGRVLKVESLQDGEHYSGSFRKVSIFMSPFDVHINRIPCEGQVVSVHYHPGKFFVASLDKASTDNERNTVVMENAKKKRVVFTQIAGLVARRIVCYLGEQRVVRRGERYGLIRFGSRMEVSFPLEWAVLVKPGDVVRGAVTPLARMDG